MQALGKEWGGGVGLRLIAIKKETRMKYGPWAQDTSGNVGRLCV